MRARHVEVHFSQRIGWLRATVLGANDGIISTASLIVGVAASGTGKMAVLTAGVAALVAGAMSMAAGEYVSVSSQSDTERSDLEREKSELAANPAHELEELTQIYEQRGLDRELAQKVAFQLTEKDALGSHLRDELGLTETHSARPIQAAWTSALSFACGAALPLLMVWLSPERPMITITSVGSLVCLVALGVLAAQLGGANKLTGALRMSAWGALAMAATALVGKLFGAVV